MDVDDVWDREKERVEAFVLGGGGGGLLLQVWTRGKPMPQPVLSQTVSMLR